MSFCVAVCCRDLRKSEHTFLLVNFFLALIGLFLIFIAAVYSVLILALCAVVGFLFHYFFFVSLLAAGAEVLYLYFALVGARWIRRYAIVTIIVSWGVCKMSACS